MSLTQATAKGSRSYQEDRSFTLETAGYLVLGVLDGHGGDYCVKFCEAAFPEHIQEWLNNEDDLSFVLKYSFADINARTEFMTEGCAASVIIIDKERKQAHVAILGDAPVYIRDNSGNIWIAPEHNVRNNHEEAEAAQKRGGFITGGYLYQSYSGHGLQMSRALGDSSLSKVLNREPEIFIINLGPESFVMVASDGVVDPSHGSGSSWSEVVGDLMHGDNAQQLVDRALAIPTNDNVTALVWRAYWTK
jgi:serine/threonine protein phosphatase PrpC